MRRQNHSCDQCRKAKRACDAPLLMNAHHGSTHHRHAPRDSRNGPSVYSEDTGHEQRVTPCSYCLKTKKRCTLSWARSQLGVGGIDSRAREDVQSGKHHRKEQCAKSRPAAAGYHAAGLFDLTPTPLPYRDFFDWGSITQNFEAVSARRDSSQGSSTLTRGSFDDTPSQAGLLNFIEDSHGESENPSGAADGMFTAFTDDDLQSNGVEDPYCSSPTFFQDYSNTGSFVASSNHVQDGIDLAPRTSERLQPDLNWVSPSCTALSPSSAEHTMISRTDNNFISQNLLRVYHDVFEHSLSCWVSDETCPYKMPIRRNSSRTGSIGMALPSHRANVRRGNGPVTVQQEWGAVWSNRIYSRVVKLDRAAQSINMIQLTRAQDQAVVKALHLAIMAFASQWAHQSRRERERFPSASGSESQDLTFSDDLAEEFDRLIQRSFWEQARKALDDCAEIECYRVVCAEIIFGLTQRPWERDDVILDISGNVSVGSEFGLRGGMNTPAAVQVQSLLSKDGPPLFLERATRKVYALKYRFDALDTDLAKAHKDYHDNPFRDLDPTGTIGTRDRETAGFVYWLAVMFDTISSSINQRPVVVTDEDCQHDAAGEIVVAGPEYGEGSNSNILRARRWSITHFIQDNPNDPVQPLRWPCSYEAAARAVTRSGPVKILLYRHVSYLQDAIRKGQSGEPIEDIIRNAVLVYCYWNTTYGVFFRDLIENYHTVPSRIQSWFFCILAHWHLAALILADLIESVDNNGLGNHEERQERLGATTVNTIRRASAGELADLARITTPPDSGGKQMGNPASPQLPDFHSAVNQGAILTEPWTMILIRAFSKAFIWRLGSVEIWQRNRALLGHGHQNCQESLAQCVDYVRALWYLGRKSDMARSVAEALSKALAFMEMGNV
ncbi:hypothetical protein F4779DRAFT_606407 [Xylariaceae sp. FL0662B]|nr:hypothetical protein F4779DRAFT_606407 [Xylariaceae sp. FL0662B]